jgi:hypothetical protein
MFSTVSARAGAAAAASTTAHISARRETEKCIETSQARL